MFSNGPTDKSFRETATQRHTPYSEASYSTWKYETKLCNHTMNEEINEKQAQMEMKMETGQVIDLQTKRQWEPDKGHSPSRLCSSWHNTYFRASVNICLFLSEHKFFKGQDE